ncbi:hypothetical protein TNCV_2864191 [Trichonephila clavipes]|nr:hypothetical protein TNCV_2864191 [Trichonephila clavipes]
MWPRLSPKARRTRRGKGKLSPSKAGLLQALQEEDLPVLYSREPLHEEALPQALPAKLALGECLKEIHPPRRLPPLTTGVKTLEPPGPLDCSQHEGKEEPPPSNAPEPMAIGDARPPPDPTPVRKGIGGIQTKRSNLKRFVCDFCERKFTTAGALEDHARSVHEVVPEMTFAFEDDGESADFTPRSVARKEQQPSVSFPCVHCSATAHMSFLSQDALDRHVAQCHVESSKPGTSANAKRVWCPHCARYLHPHQTLVQHIREAHNESFEAKKSGQAHTKVVRFATDNVVDAAACSSTPAYNVLCPDGLRPVAASTDPATRADDEHQAGSSRDPARPGDNSNAQRSTGTHQQAGVSMKFKCDHCNRVLGSLKGRAYHMREKHGVPLGRSWIKGNEDANAQRATGSPPTTPPPEDLPPPVVDNDACSVSTQKVGAALLGETLRLTHSRCPGHCLAQL